MATKPTRLQQQACERLAEALHLIAESSRLDGQGKLDPCDLDEIALRISRVSSAFPLDTIVVKAIELRARSLKLSSSAAELIALADGELDPLQTLRLGNREFVELVEKLENDLGGL